MYDINTWGKTTWIFFHTIAEKIDNNKFKDSIEDIENIITLICGNLPCPECSKHASMEMKKVNFKSMTDKKQLQMMLFNFHNKVNSHLKKKIYNEDDLNIYKKANFNLIYNNFFIIFGSNSNIPQLMNQSFHRQYNLPKIKASLDRIKNNFIS